MVRLLEFTIAARGTPFERDVSKLARRGPPKSKSQIAVARSHVSKHISRHLPYYLTPDEAHALIDAALNERDQLFLRMLWETGARISEAIGVKLADVSRDGVRVLGKVASSG